MQGEGLLKGNFLCFFLGQTPVDEELVNQRIDETYTNGVLSRASVETVRLSADMVFSLVQWWLVFSP